MAVQLQFMAAPLNYDTGAACMTVKREAGIYTDSGKVNGNEYDRSVPDTGS